MEKLQITYSLVENILHSAQHTFPDEFLALLGGDQETRIVNELVVVPATFGKNFSSLRSDLIPFDPKIIGSIHSHPSDSNEPSAGDLQSFARLGKYHLIVAYPYRVDCIVGYDSGGKRLELEILEEDPNFI